MPPAPKDLSRRHLTLGEKGETAALRFLKNEGYQILEQNFRTPIGEIDIVAREGETLVFVEVKTRSGIAFGFPQDAVGKQKQFKITQVALLYLSSINVAPCHCRFDVVAVQKAFKGYHVELIRNAFEMAV
ncbi:MAG: YraN family protein [Nitrospiria bacterium]